MIFFKKQQFDDEVYDEFKEKISPILSELDDEDEIASVIKTFLESRGYFWVEKVQRWMKAGEA